MFWTLSAVWTALFALTQWLNRAQPERAREFSFNTPQPSFFDSIPAIDPIVWILGLIAIYGFCGINIINEWDRRPFLLFGRYKRTAGPGFAWVDPAFHKSLEDVFVRDSVYELEIGNVQTHDNVPISFQLILTIRVKEDAVRRFVVEIDDGFDAVQQRALASVTEEVGNSELDNILHKRSDFYVKVREDLQKKVDNWGVLVTAVELKDIKITDPSIEQAIAMKARARKEADAELTRAEMQGQIAKMLRTASESFDDATWRLKNMEVLIELCRSATNNTIMIPTDLLKGLEDIIPDRLKRNAV